ncbi:DUF4180 domain-containing protein [Paenibacillus doosanensis]|uniref:DUF4180 domain-containing protein n=1 Tax=Paenibacillus konkukensis TaxID=2020716 RepID=A0ABY4RTF9_9BACL|nr:MULTISPECIES: DUF4180 domain-containing protein [Paenibacillus]MCS7459680.1 DUF4180 domain-containing protein [Paenibacillus doosanensis]UQZ84659.1 hypothetical protein SK3146_03914 [Paenibacillus konkukensis]
MDIRVDRQGDSKVAVVISKDVLIKDTQDALDLMSTVSYTEQCDKMVIEKGCITETFFDLSTKLAGEILQKYTQYQFKIAIIGDFSGYKSKSLKDFIYECNQGKQVFFLPDEAAGLQALHRLP